MKIIQHFICEYCGTEYTDETLARKCESYHIKPKKIEKITEKKYWNPVQEGMPEKASNRYPRRINVEMEDGSVWMYEMMRDYTRKKKAQNDKGK